MCASERGRVWCGVVWSVDVCRNESTTLRCYSEDPTELDSVKKALTTTLKKNTKGADTGLPPLAL